MSIAKKLTSLGAVFSLLLAGAVLLNGNNGWAAQQSAAMAAPAEQAPYALKEFIKLVKHNKKDLQTLLPSLKARGVGFEVTPQIEKKLHKAGASPEFIATVKDYTPSAVAARAKGPHHVFSKAESDAYNKVKQQTDPAAIIQAANDFAEKFPKSPLLTYVYGMEAAAYQLQNDPQNVVKYGEKSLVLDSSNLMSLLMVASILPQPQMMNVPDAMKLSHLNLAETYANKALKEIGKLPKLPNETDPAYEARKNGVASRAYAALGMVHLERAGMAIQPPDMKELGLSEQNYRTAIAKAQTPAPTVYYRLGEVCSQQGKMADAISAFSNASKLGQGTIIQQLADQQIAALKQKQSQAGAAGK